MNPEIQRIVITGPECTGKSALTETLAGHYNTPWVAEFARSYLFYLGRPYNFDDLGKMAQGQVMLEDFRATEVKNAPLLFIDTDLITYKIWYQHKYGEVPHIIQQQIRERKYHHYLLCYPDIPWENDLQRENPGKGEFFFDWYEREIRATGTPYSIIRGMGEERISNAITAVENCIAVKP